MKGRRGTSTFSVVMALTVLSTCIAFYDLLLLATNL